MAWYRNMSETEKQSFRKVAAVCIVGTVIILSIPMVLQMFL